jgi:hypothetical protein
LQLDHPFQVLPSHGQVFGFADERAVFAEATKDSALRAVVATEMKLPAADGLWAAFDFATIAKLSCQSSALRDS